MAVCEIWVAAEASKGLPHIHHRQANMLGFMRPQPLIELIHALLRTINATEPNRSSLFQITDYNLVGVPFAQGYFVDSNNLRSHGRGPSELLLHLLFLKFLDRFPVQMKFFGHISNRRTAAAFAYIEGEPFGIKRIVRQE